MSFTIAEYRLNKAVMLVHTAMGYHTCEYYKKGPVECYIIVSPATVDDRGVLSKDDAPNVKTLRPTEVEGQEFLQKVARLPQWNGPSHYRRSSDD